MIIIWLKNKVGILLIHHIIILYNHDTKTQL